jgi:hypothetical protein
MLHLTIQLLSLYSINVSIIIFRIEAPTFAQGDGDGFTSVMKRQVHVFGLHSHTKVVNFGINSNTKT